MEYHSFLFLSINTFKTCNSEWFPSPYGVSFILMKNNLEIFREIKNIMQVSVSLWSIIHSYKIKGSDYMVDLEILGFRLLMEYHSFL